MLDARADQVVPHLTNEPSWPTLRHTSSAWQRRPVSTHSSNCRLGPISGEAVQLVTDIANQIRDHAGQDDTQPLWAPSSRPNLAIMGEVAVWRAANGIPPATDDQPEPDSCRQLQPSGNTTSTEVSPAAAMTTSVILTSKRPRLLQPHVIAGTNTDSACPNHPRSTRTRHPPPAYRSAPQVECGGTRWWPANAVTSNLGLPQSAAMLASHSLCRRSRWFLQPASTLSTPWPLPVR
jgi:hypothetical protein